MLLHFDANANHLIPLTFVFQGMQMFGFDSSTLKDMNNKQTNKQSNMEFRQLPYQKK